MKTVIMTAAVAGFIFAASLAQAGTLETMKADSGVRFGEESGSVQAVGPAVAFESALGAQPYQAMPEAGAAQAKEHHAASVPMPAVREDAGGVKSSKDEPGDLTVAALILLVFIGTFAVPLAGAYLGYFVAGKLVAAGAPAVLSAGIQVASAVAGGVAGFRVWDKFASQD